jgi:bacillithiol biosynthesis deacetylase BshB1
LQKKARISILARKLDKGVPVNSVDKLDVLAIGAHPDDVEISCGGTILKLVSQGRKVGLCDLTAGELGTRGTPDLRAQEARDAARILGVSTRVCLNMPDGNIEVNIENREKLIRLIRRFRPATLIFPHGYERHPDHEHAHRLCREAWFYSGLARIETGLDGATQSAFRPGRCFTFMQSYEFQPSFVVDVSAEFDRRMEAMMAFRSQFHDPTSGERETALSRPEFLRFVEARLEYFGHRIGVRYGEPFAALDLVGVRSISDIIW